MGRKEVGVYIFIILLVSFAFLFVYFSNLRLTGFATFQQQDQSSFDEGAYENVEWNGSAVVLSVNQTSGTYTSKIFDAGNESFWNNLTWQGEGNLTFEVRNCSSSDCSSESFASQSLTDLDISSQYFQYKAYFENDNPNVSIFLESVVIDYSNLSSETEEEVVGNISIIISQPTGTIYSLTDIPISYTVVGNDTSCSYNIKTSSGSSVVGNTSLANCSNSAFNISEGNYVITIYANSSSESEYNMSNFSIVDNSEEDTSSTDDSSSSSESDSDDDEDSDEVESTIQIPITSRKKELTLSSIDSLVLNPSNSQPLSLNAKNTGNVNLTSCKLIAGGNYSSWITAPEDSQGLKENEEKTFSFSIKVPEDVEEMDYAFPVTIKCLETTKSSEFSVQVIKKRVTFNLVGVERTEKDSVAVDYSLQELLNEEQTVKLDFQLLNAENQEIARASEEKIILGGETKDFETSIPIDESIEGDVVLVVDINSQTYSTSLRESVVLTPIGGFAVLGNLNGGNITLGILVILFLGFALFITKKVLVDKKTFRDLWGSVLEYKERIVNKIKRKD